jgi:hypothetical protein
MITLTKNTFTVVGCDTAQWFLNNGFKNDKNIITLTISQ